MAVYLKLLFYLGLICIYEEVKDHVNTLRYRILVEKYNDAYKFIRILYQNSKYILWSPG